MTDFLDKISEQTSKNIAIDFDGVIHKNSKGFHDGTIYDDPVVETEEALKKLCENGYNLIIFTCKANPERPFVDGKTGKELIWEWLQKHNLDKYISDVVLEKPRALYYIDDKAIEFYSWNSTLQFIFN